MEAPSADDAPDLWGDDDIAKIVQSAARRARGRFSGYISLEDTIQEGWLAVYTTKKLAEWQGQGQEGRNRLYRLVLKSCALYGHREKAAKIGYKYGDLFFYGIMVMRKILPAVLDSYEDQDPYEDFSDRSLWMDVNVALATLTEAEYQIIWWAFHGDPEESEGYANVAGHLGLSADAARQRVNRILRRMQDTLGGENPAPRRYRRSNAQALAETRSAWEGEG